jgi:uncharacterized protein (TIGR02145 family)
MVLRYFAFLLFFFLGCTQAERDDPGDEKSVKKVNCEWRNYKTTKIGNQTWMAENLNCDVIGSKCYNNDPANCDRYGRLYNWMMALKVCPSGWHLPSDAEWITLTDYVGNNAGTKLKATSGWNNNGNGTDDYGFAALPGGRGSSGGGFLDAGYYGYWWSSSVYRANYAYYRGMGYGTENVHRIYDNYKADLFSVRCLQD